MVGSPPGGLCSSECERACLELEDGELDDLIDKEDKGAVCKRCWLTTSE